MPGQRSRAVVSASPPARRSFRPVDETRTQTHAVVAVVVVVVVVVFTRVYTRQRVHGSSPAPAGSSTSAAAVCARVGQLRRGIPLRNRTSAVRTRGRVYCTYVILITPRCTDNGAFTSLVDTSSHRVVFSNTARLGLRERARQRGAFAPVGPR